MTQDKLPVQPTINMGLVGHVDHGKTSITKLLSGTWTDTHSEEKKRGITIKLGYTNFTIYKDKENYNVKKTGTPIKKISIVDAPGHESFMATMISGAAVMDCALLVIAADEKCPQPQTAEHLKTLEISGIKDIIIVQNKIDLVSKERAVENFKEIRDFVKGTVAENVPIVPISAQHGANISELLKLINEKFKEPKRNLETNPKLYIVRSFDINKPGTPYNELKGGIIGGTIKEGQIRIGDEIEIKPGIKRTREGRTFYETIIAKVEGLKSDKDSLEVAGPGGSIAIITKLDPIVTKTDSLVGQIAGIKGHLDDAKYEIKFEPKLFESIIDEEGESSQSRPLYQTEPLMMIINSMATVGIVAQARPQEVTVKLKKPVMAFSYDRVVIFRKVGNKWKISGYGIIS